ncbi:hypothetical protein OFC56_36565, partial [Escherichia coli]|nr:hypothetical protein [Escherichia coli]
VTVSDGSGGTRTETRTRYSKVQVLMRYSKGRFRVGTSRADVLSEGFRPSLHLTDGYGIAVAPHTGKRHEIHNTCTVGESVLGIE